jgi:hypothetical protein
MRRAAVIQGLGVAGRTVKFWAEQQGEPLGGLSQAAAKTRMANAAARDYGVAERIALGNAFFERIAEVLPLAEPKEIYNLAMAYAVTIDKRRLEEGLTKADDTVPADPENEIALARARLQVAK